VISHVFSTFMNTSYKQYSRLILLVVFYAYLCSAAHAMNQEIVDKDTLHDTRAMALTNNHHHTRHPLLIHHRTTAPAPANKKKEEGST